MIRFDVCFSVAERKFEIAVSDQMLAVGVHFDQDDYFAVEFGTIQEVTIHKDADPYKGAYHVTPKVDGQILPTAQKLMADDLTVKAIPYYETSNLSDGETVYIGTEVDIYGD